MAKLTQLLKRGAASPLYRALRSPPPRSDGDRERIQLGHLCALQHRGLAPSAFAEAEFSVFSQFGEDGIIQHLLNHCPPVPPTFVEFGVEDYTEANTRFLAVHDYWSGLVMDGNAAHVEQINRSYLAWKYGVRGVHAFITRENINELIAGAGLRGRIGLLSVDIDGNDYWVWDALHCVDPDIVIAEYNATFGPTARVSVPYTPAFRRTEAHHSNLYWGCSLSALEFLAASRGYSLVATNRAGNNAFFVHQRLAAPFAARPAADVYRPACFRESRDRDGNLTYLDAHAALELIAPMPVVDVATGQRLALRDLV